MKMPLPVTTQLPIHKMLRSRLKTGKKPPNPPIFLRLSRLNRERVKTMVEKAIITQVVIPNKDDSVELQIRRDDEVLTFILDGKRIFSGDWDNNLKEVFKEALQDW